MKTTTIRKVNCKECGSNVFTPEIDDNEVKTWECACCMNITSRNSRTSKKQREVNELFSGMFTK